MKFRLTALFIFFSFTPVINAELPVSKDYVDEKIAILQSEIDQIIQVTHQ